jgi:CBS domain-containing protein
MTSLTQTKVSEWMTESVISVEPNTAIQEARRTMKDYGIRHLPVTRNGTLVGVLSIGDIREAAPSDVTSLSVWEMNYLWEKITVEQVMTHHVFTAKAPMTMIEAAEMMLIHKISGLPVVDDAGKLVGIVTETDIFRMLVEVAKHSTTA